MSEDYVIEWDDKFAEDLKSVADVFLQHNPMLWPDIFSRLATSPESFENDDEDEYGLQDILDCSGGDLGNNELVQVLLQVLHGEGLTMHVDWKGENDDGEMANFAANRYYELTDNQEDAETLRSLLLEMTEEDEIAEACEGGDRYLDEVFERIQNQLNKHNLQIFDLNEGTDTYSIAVLPMSDYKKIDEFKTQWLEIQNFLS